VVEDKKKTSAKKTAVKKSSSKTRQSKNNPVAKKVEKAPIVVDVPRVKKIYNDEVVPVLKKEFGYKNPMQVPPIKKIVVNISNRYFSSILLRFLPCYFH
jgi:large subunit ribosomal protein L5